MTEPTEAKKIVENLRKIQNDERVDFHAREYAELAANEIERLTAAAQVRERASDGLTRAQVETTKQLTQDVERLTAENEHLMRLVRGALVEITAGTEAPQLLPIYGATEDPESEK